MALSIGCAPVVALPKHGASPTSSSGNPTPAEADAIEPRWLRLPSEGGGRDFELQLPSGDKLRIRDGIRTRVRLDGGIESASERLTAAGPPPTAIPERLGGGFVFTAETSGETSLWRAKTWTGTLQPLTRVDDPVSRVVVGFDRLYLLRTPSGEVTGIDLETGENLGLGPLPEASAINDIAVVDDWFGAVVSDVRGVLVTFDAGETWHPTALREPGISLRSESDHIWVSAGPHSIERDGRVRPIPRNQATTLFTPASHLLFGLPDAETEPVAALPLGTQPLSAAVLHGWPTGPDSALVATGGALAQVRLSDGAILRLQRRAYPGSATCDGALLGQKPAFVCSEQVHGTHIFEYDAAFRLRPVLAFDQPRFVNTGENGAFVVQGGCAQTADPGIETEAGHAFQRYCIVYPPTAPREIRVSGDVGVERVAVMRDGRVVVIVPPRLGAEGRLTIISAQGQREQSIRTSATPEMKALIDTGLWLNSVTQVADNAVGTWVAGAEQYVGIRLKLDDGHVTQGKVKQGDLKRTVLNGPRALELSAGGIAWQTTDYGFHWQDLPLPRGLSPLDPTDSDTNSLETATQVGCSRVGCAVGDWLRLGYTRSVPSSTPSEFSLDLHDAPSPTKLADNPVQYSSWQLHCYPSGEQALGPSRAGNQSSATPRAQRGLVSGFKSSGLLTAAQTVDIDSTANRPFLGTPRPATPRNTLAFDMGADGDTQFRAYTWGEPAEAWQRSSAWLMRAADRFVLDAIWTTAVTRAPWADFVTAAQTFGADRANRSVASWHFEADPDEAGGVVKVSTGTTSELHFVEKDSPIASLSGVSVGTLAGVVKVAGQWYFGAHEGGAFQVYAAESQGIRKIGSYPVNSTASTTLVRTSDGAALGLAVRTRKGTLHIFPLPLLAEPEAPISFTREQLNREWPACPPDREGWLLRSGLPLSRAGNSDVSNVVEFEGDALEWRVHSVLARVVLTDSNICVDALAAQVSNGKVPAPRLRAALPGAQSTIPLTVTDRATDVRTGFRCVP